MKYRIVLLPAAQAMIEAISDRRVVEKIGDRIDRLADDPEKQGKPLGDKLVGFRSVRAVGQRYRILYKVERDRVWVLVATVGMRKEGDKKDIYEVAKRMWRQGLLDLADESE